MKKIYRLRKNWEFANIMETNHQVLNRHLIIYFLPAKELKVGIVTPKKFCNAVLRNYYKRQMKSIIHDLNIYNWKFHMVVILRKDFLNLEFAKKKNIVKNLLETIENESNKVRKI
ncbi:ribonuclease P protein component [Mycoplasmopsis opalescens]|uniref:ribonuclease P protein component n=1 Tax=Mycoplasmopsis opalescens TaxID=114886 RepID=UPI0004A6D92D|nr:ribonuclease P protein component [Mycoplasmopsis opalescens]